MKNILIIDNESKHTKKIANLFPDDKITFCKYNKIPDTKAYNLIILSWWSHYSVLKQPSHYKKEITLIKNTKIPLLWICLWFQLIAHVFWSTLTEMSKKLRGKIEIKNWLDKKTYKVFEAHRYSVTKLWSDLKWIAKSIYGYEIIRHKTRPIRWFQFHPEVDMIHTWGKKIIKEIMDLMF